MILNNQNDMYLYFQMINELQPDSVLDAGMFLKRAGSVSRQMMGCGISEDVRLDGIDFSRSFNSRFGKPYIIKYIRGRDFLRYKWCPIMIWAFCWGVIH